MIIYPAADSRESAVLFFFYLPFFFAAAFFGQRAAIFRQLPGVRGMSAAVMRASAPRLTSAVGLLAMLEEQEAQIKAHALTKLNAVVPDFWYDSSIILRLT